MDIILHRHSQRNIRQIRVERYTETLVGRYKRECKTERETGTHRKYKRMKKGQLKRQKDIQRKYKRETGRETDRRYELEDDKLKRKGRE